MRNILIPVIGSLATLLAACGGEDGDTIVQGGNDKQARDSIAALEARIATLESEVLALETTTSDLDSLTSELNSDLATAEADIANLQSSNAVVVRDSGDVVIGRFIGSYDQSVNVGALTSEGKLFNITADTYGFRNIAEEIYFSGDSCSGQAYVLRSNFDPQSQQEAAFPDKTGYIIPIPTGAPTAIYYLPPKTTLETSAPVESFTNGTTCQDISTTEDAYPVSVNDPLVTGFPNTVGLPLSIK